MALIEAKARISRLELLAEDLGRFRPECATLATEVGCLPLGVSTRLAPGVWAGPAAGRASTGFQAAMTQSGRGCREIESLDAMVIVATDVARQVAAELRQPATVAEQAASPMIEARCSRPAACRCWRHG